MTTVHPSSDGNRYKDSALCDYGQLISKAFLNTTIGSLNISDLHSHQISIQQTTFEIFYTSSPILDSPKNLDPPVFIKSLEDCSVDEGTDLVLRGVLTGSQPIKVTWLHNGKQRKLFAQYVGSNTPAF